jgi:hypothetical protein
MKEIKSHTALHKIYRRLVLIAGIFILNMIPGNVMAQTDSTKPAEPAVEKEESSLISPSAEFISVQKADNTIDLKIAMQAKIKGTFYKLPLLKVAMYLIQQKKQLGL